MKAAYDSEDAMEAIGLLAQAAEWGRLAVKAANNKAQQRDAALVEKAATLVAGLKYLDRRFTELFVPLVFFDPGSWPIERRRKHAEEILGFIHGDRIISTLRETLEYLEHSGSDDRQMVGLLDELVNVVHTCLWGQFADGAEVPDPVDEDFRAVSAPRLFKMDEVYFAGEPTWVDYIKNRAEPRLVDPDSFSEPAVARLVEILRSDEPAIQDVARAASACLLGPGSPADEDHRLFGRLSYFAQQDEVAPIALNTVSPVRYYADYAGRVFQQLMSVVRQSFPGLPEPSWVWQPG